RRFKDGAGAQANDADLVPGLGVYAVFHKYFLPMWRQAEPDSVCSARTIAQIVRAPDTNPLKSPGRSPGKAERVSRTPSHSIHTHIPKNWQTAPPITNSCKDSC